MSTTERAEIRLTRFIRATREKVFDAFVIEALMRQWYSPRGMSVPQASVDARIGGAWQLTILARDGTRFVVGGNYHELRRPERLAYTWKWEGGGPMTGLETLIEIDLVTKDGGTELRLRHSGFTDAMEREAHAHGWNSVMNRLNDLLDPRGSATTLTLFGDARSTYTRTAGMGLAEKGIAYTLQPCGPHAPEILAINPFGRIPALRDGEIAVFETSAILRYLEESFDAPPLLPGTVLGRTRCEQWLSAVNAYLYDTMAKRYVLQYLMPRGADGAPDRAVIESALKEMPGQLRALDQAYAKGDFIAGANLSMADLFIAPILAYVDQMPEGPHLLEMVGNVRRAQAVIRSRGHRPIHST